MSSRGDVEDASIPIATMAVIDLETNDLPTYQFNQCGITELTVYAFSVNCLNHHSIREMVQKRASANNGDYLEEPGSIPKLPRVLHKLTLMVNPLRRISDMAEQLTGTRIPLFPLFNESLSTLPPLFRIE